MSDELAPGAVSLEGGTLDGPEQTPLPAAPETGQADASDPDPEGVVEVQGRRMVPVDALVAERRRVRESSERIAAEKMAPLEAKAREADELRSALTAAQPYLDHLRQHPELLQPPAPTPIEATISDDEARNEARDLELYAADGQPDLARAKRIIGRRRTEVMSAAQQAAHEAVGPITSASALQSSRHNFVQMAASAHGQVDPAHLARMWASLPAELTQHPQVGELVLNAAIGEAVRAGRAAPSGGRPPQLSEPSGGRPGPGFRMNTLTQRIAREAGMSDQAFTKAAEGFRPNDINVIGD